MSDAEQVAGKGLDAGSGDSAGDDDEMTPKVEKRKGVFGGLKKIAAEPSFTKPAERRPAKRLFVTVNPFGGKKGGLSILKAVQPVFEEAGAAVEVKTTEYAGHNYELAHSLDLAQYDVFVVFGGDGSVHEVINGMLNRPDGKTIPIGIVPAGTGNSFAEDLGQPKPRDAARRIVEGWTQEVDVARVHWPEDAEQKDLWMFNLLQWPAGYLKKAEELRWAGPSRYKISTGIDVLKGAFAHRVKLTVDGESMETATSWFMCLNNQHTGKKMRAAPVAKIDDGLFDLVMVKKIGKMALTDVLGGMESGLWVHSKHVEYRRFKTLRLENLDPSKSAIVNVDGEICAKDPFEMTVVPAAFRVVVAAPSVPSVP